MTRTASFAALLAFGLVGTATTLAKPTSPTPAERGRALYTAKCQACHGPTGKGDGPASTALPEPPADFSSPEYWAKTDGEQVKAAIKAGKPGTVMRGFPMPDADLDALLVHLRSFASDK
jgi:high-affinity iron transporter